MSSIDNERHERKRVPEDKFRDAGNVHGYSAEEIEASGDSVDGGNTASFEFQERQNNAGEWDHETDDTQERRVS